MKVHLVDGTYELFRQNFGRLAKETDPGPFAATVGVLRSTLQLLADGATHVAVASDHVIESFRNDLWPTYKTSAGMPPELLAQLSIVEDALRAASPQLQPMARTRSSSTSSTAPTSYFAISTARGASTKARIRRTARWSACSTPCSRCWKPAPRTSESPPTT